MDKLVLGEADAAPVADVDAVDHLGMLLDHEVVALIEYHKLHGDAGEVLKDADRIETVLGITPEDRALRTSGLDTEQPNPAKNTNDAAEYMQKLEERFQEEMN